VQHFTVLALNSAWHWHILNKHITYKCMQPAEVSARCQRPEVCETYPLS